MTEEEAEYLRGLRRRAKAVLDDLEGRPAPTPEEEQQRRRIIERFQSVLEDAEEALSENGRN